VEEVTTESQRTLESVTDADVTSIQAVIEPAPAAMSSSRLTHSSSPGEIVALARALFSFTGEALVCRIPVRDLSAGETLTAEGLRLVQETARQLESFL
jgi:hypothetical protein